MRALRRGFAALLLALPCWVSLPVAAARRSLPATDTFNRTDASCASGALGANWTQQNGESRIFDNASRGCASVGSVFWNADTFSNDHYSEATDGAGAFGQYAVTVRASGTGGSAHFCGLLVRDGLAMRFIEDDPSNVLETTDDEAVAGDTVKLEIVGTTMTAYINDVAVDTNTACTITSGGAAGIYQTVSVDIDTWEGGDVGGAAPSNLPAIINSPIRGGGIIASFHLLSLLRSPRAGF